MLHFEPFHDLALLKALLLNRKLTLAELRLARGILSLHGKRALDLLRLDSVRLLRCLRFLSRGALISLGLGLHLRHLDVRISAAALALLTHGILVRRHLRNRVKCLLEGL